MTPDPFVHLSVKRPCTSCGRWSILCKLDGFKFEVQPRADRSTPDLHRAACSVTGLSGSP